MAGSDKGWLLTTRRLRFIDLFSGCGGLSEGFRQAAWEPVFAVEKDRAAASSYRKNFGCPVWNGAIEDLVPLLECGQLRLPNVDAVIGGPPCQGHSNLNNHTRRDDPKNRLYERMARFAELVKPTHIICENVSAVLHDKGHVVEKTATCLRALGYTVSQGVVDVASLGVPQRRRRHVLVASLVHKPDVATMLASYAREERSVAWVGVVDPDQVAVAAHLRDDRHVGERLLELVTQLRAALAHTFDQPLAPDHVEDGETDGAR